MSAKPKRLKPGEYHELRAQAHALWPATFPARGEPCKPLAIGIRKNILADKRFDVANRTKHTFLRIWTNRLEYLDAVISAGEGGSRYDLEGNPSGEISQKELEYATQRAAELRRQAEKRAARRAAAAEQKEGGRA